MEDRVKRLEDELESLRRWKQDAAEWKQRIIATEQAVQDIRKMIYGLTEKLTDVRVVGGQTDIETAAAAKAAHRRIDEHLQDHRDVRRSIFSLWVGVVIAAIGAAAAVVRAVMSGY